MPDWLTPMAATLTEERFDGPEWTFERKFDGIRLIAFKRGAEVQLYSRNRLPQQVPSVAAVIAALPHEELILDGEMTWEGDGYDVFDVLWIDGHDLRARPLEERRALLRELPLRAPVRHVRALDGERPWERACAEGWEGVIAKRRDSVYEGKRSKAWLKMKCEVIAELWVGGFTEPQGKRVGLGALLVGKRDGDQLIFAGKVGTGFDTAMLLDLRRRLDAMEIARSPFTRAIGLPRQAHWTRPEIAVEVAFIEWTDNDKMRHPRLLAVKT